MDGKVTDELTIASASSELRNDNTEEPSVSEHEVIEKAGSFHEGKEPPRVFHFVARELPRKRKKRN